MQVTDNAKVILERRYLKRVEGKIVEDATGMAHRVALCVSDVDTNPQEAYEKFFEVIDAMEFLPNSPTLMNAGKEDAQLSACFVLPIEDHMEGIFDAIKNMALVQKTGGGTGFSFSRLRASGATVSSTYGVASGPVSFMRVFNAATEEVKQGGTRRGANMGILRVDHPDIEEFITCKETGGITNFNISVAITDKFMEALTREDDTFLLLDPSTKKTIKVVSARMLWALLVHHAWQYGDPGIIFIDEINRHNPTPHIGEIEATNPCIVGSTLIQTVEGMIPIKDLVGKEIDVYCVNDKYQLTISRAKNIRMTRREATLLEVKTTKGTVICTADHKFYTRNRGYVPAIQLQTSDKLVALNKAPKNQKYSKVYLTGTGANVPAEHVFIAQHYYGDLTGKDVHHVDDDPKHNIYSNLEVKNHGDHSVISNRGHIDWCMHDPATGRWLPKVKEAKDGGNALGVHPVGVNMRLISLKPLSYTEAVYDMEVEEHHNFFANYVLIHNCGEQPLLPNEACCLGSINLKLMVREATIEGDHRPYREVNWPRLREVIEIAVRFLDDVIDAQVYPLSEIEKQHKGNRKIGLGVMGWADMLIQLDIPYASQEAVDLAETVAKFIQNVGHAYSQKLGEERGNYPNWVMGCPKRRNATVTTIAPTGTISMIAGASSGVEPIFGVVFDKHVMDNDIIHEFNPLFPIYKYGDDVLDSIIKSGSANELGVTEQDILLFKGAMEISPEWHLSHQAAWQAYVDNAVSKTINLRSDADEETVERIYMDAWKNQCKGITIYRDGCKGDQVIYVGGKKPSITEIAQAAANSATVIIAERPMILRGLTAKMATAMGSLYVTLNCDEFNNPFECFIEMGRAGSDIKTFTEALARLISISMRAGLSLETIMHQLKDIRGTVYGFGPTKVQSVPDAIAKCLRELAFKEEVVDATSNRPSYELCPECGVAAFIRESGCGHCTNCPHSECN